MIENESKYLFSMITIDVYLYLGLFCKSILSLYASCYGILILFIKVSKYNIVPKPRNFQISNILLFYLHYL